MISPVMATQLKHVGETINLLQVRICVLCWLCSQRLWHCNKKSCTFWIGLL